MYVIQPFKNMLISPLRILNKGLGNQFGRRSRATYQRIQTMGSVRIAVGQMTSRNDTNHNFNICKQLCEEAAAKGAIMLFLPECFSFIGASQSESLAIAEPIDGPIMQRYQELARKHKLWLSLGGFQEQGPSEPPPAPAEAQAQPTFPLAPDIPPQELAAQVPTTSSAPTTEQQRRIYNAHVVLSDTGVVAAHYRKIHLFDVDVPNGPVLLESRTTLPGDKLVVCDSPVGSLALTVCYDLRFPELWQRLAFDLGAQIIAVPSAFTKTTGEAHWELLCRARAVECQAFVVAAAQAGKHSERRESFGHSLVVDPWGDILAKLDGTQTGVAIAELDFGRLQTVRQKMPIEHHRIGFLQHCLGYNSVYQPIQACERQKGHKAFR